MENYFDILQYFCVMKKKIQKKIKVKIKNKLLKPCLILFLGGQFQWLVFVMLLLVADA